MTGVVDVAVAVLYRPDGSVLVQKRAEGSHQGGLWEFPGGKLEPGENVEQALLREIQEELGVLISKSRPLISVRHTYHDLSVCLHVYWVESWIGDVTAVEGQPLQWVGCGELSSLDMPAADKPIISAIQLPPRFFITPEKISDPDHFLLQATKLFSDENGVLLYRVKDQGDQDEQHFFLELKRIADQSQIPVIRHSMMPFTLPGCGVHFSEKEIRENSYLGMVSGSSDQQFGASCHSLEAVLMAQQAGMDYVFLSPVKATSSHPGASPLGWAKFQSIVNQVNIPVYALGGMSVSDISESWKRGAQGIAGISLWWKPK